MSFQAPYVKLLHRRRESLGTRLCFNLYNHVILCVTHNYDQIPAKTLMSGWLEAVLLMRDVLKCVSVGGGGE